MFPVNSGLQRPLAAENELVHEPDSRLGRMSNPDLLAWMGRAFGDAVERANHKPFASMARSLESLIQALPAADLHNRCRRPHHVL